MRYYCLFAILTYPAGHRGNPYFSVRATREPFLFRLRNAHRRKRRKNYYEQLVSTRFANIPNTTIGIRATNFAFGLRRTPVGFCAVLRHGSLEWKTESKASQVNHDVVEWSGLIPM